LNNKKEVLFSNEGFILSNKMKDPLRTKGRTAWVVFMPNYHYETHINLEVLSKMLKKPNKEEIWSLGIVQNVIHQSVNIYYSKNTQVQKTWGPMLDCLSTNSIPYITPPFTYSIETEEPDPILQSNTNIKYSVNSSYVVEFSSEGMILSGENKKQVDSGITDYDQNSDIITKKSKAEREAPLRNPTLPFIMEDYPKMSLPFNLNGEILMRAERVMVIRFWIILKGPDNKSVFYLRMSPFLTLATFIEFKDSKTERFYDPRTPRCRSGCGANTVGMQASNIVSIIKTLNEQDKNIKFLPPVYSDALPKMKEPIANIEVQKWADENLPIERGLPF
jgi:hypothetical protein